MHVIVHERSCDRMIDLYVRTYLQFFSSSLWNEKSHHREVCADLAKGSEELRGLCRGEEVQGCHQKRHNILTFFNLTLKVDSQYTRNETMSTYTM